MYRFKRALTYHFDNFMAKGIFAFLTAILILTFTISAISALFLLNADPNIEKQGFINILSTNMQEALRISLRGGTIYSVIGGVIIGVGGLLMAAMLGSVLNYTLFQKIHDLRRGRSMIYAKNHVVILGWSMQVHYIIGELIIANQHNGGVKIVIMGEEDKLLMEETIREKLKLLFGFKNYFGTKIVCRSGNTSTREDIDILSLDTARAIIVLGSDNNQHDINVIKTLLAITNAVNPPSATCTITAAVKSEDYYQAAVIASNDRATLVVSDPLMARISAQSCNQPGLATIYGELLSFKGDEIYFSNSVHLTGRKFSDVLLQYPDSIVIGIRTKNGVNKLLPDMNHIFESGESVILIAEDDTLIGEITTKSHKIDNLIKHKAILGHPRTTMAPPRANTLILGWNSRAEILIREMDAYIGPGSHTTVICQPINIGDENKIIEIINNLDVVNQHINFISKDIMTYNSIREVNVEKYSCVLVLTSDDVDTKNADSKTLMTLMYLRGIAKKTNKHFAIISEMQEPNNRELAQSAYPDDFIISSKIVSLILTQYAENINLKSIYDDIFDSDGAEIYLKDVTRYLHCNQQVNFYTAIAAAANQGHIAIGYRIMKYKHDKTRNYGVVINPVKDKEIIFHKEDQLIVFSES
ncbi:CASTOR/POLLUX-related putative ion channel [Yersinia mollaretii]|uniref:CASTOR/POLLUX-related putative ion channel n=1 Tax=Yersinia mollaretii TaxID=33060 RepID=UPI0025AA5503|nr:hypothetical protein [Yersinia mollaretii]MDN0111413.1 hypothetical protein [Yersinia mollaretii]